MHDHSATLLTEHFLPTNITRILDDAGIAFTTHSLETIDPALHVHHVLLEDADKKLLVIVPRTHIINLSQLNSTTDSTWRAAKSATVTALLARLQLDQLPALPQLLKLDSLCDPTVFTQPKAYLDSGIAGVVLALEPAALARLLDSSQQLSCTEPITHHHPNHGCITSDAETIQQAVVGLTSLRIHKRLEETLEIPLLNSTAKKILRLRNDNMAGVDELAAIVETDPALAAQVIAWASSPFYAAPGKIRSVEDAIARVLGFDLVINLALGLSLGKSLTLPADQPQHAQPYWQKAIYTAALIEGLTRTMPMQNKPEVGLTYLAGLLHNFGFALLAHLFPPHYTLVCRSLEANIHLSHSVIEYHLLGITREQMGAWLMQCWQIPDELVYALRHQDDPSYQGEHEVYANLTCLAQRLLLQHTRGLTTYNGIPEELYQRLHLSADSAQTTLQQVFDAEHALRALVAQFNQ